MTELATRYGRPSRARRTAVVTAVAVVAAAGLAWLAWAAAFHSTPAARSQLVSYEVRSEHEAVATVTVIRRSTTTPATCRLRALSEDHAVVGERIVTVEAGPRTQTLDTSVRTERRATGVELVGCTAPGQPRPR